MDVQPSRRKLGLALAGGGFRASLFHLGVLRRLAELDLLRRVEVLSTVSGGSIIGALYVMLLKDRLEKQATLEREDYIKLIDELDDLLTTGIGKDLRTRLLLNPLGVLRIMLTGDSLGNRMARLYERHLFRTVVARLERRQVVPWHWRMLRPGALPLRDLRMQPKGADLRSGIEAHNRGNATSASAVTTIVLNATSLNSGGRFFFSSVEVGDWYLGYVRFDEIPALLARKRLVQELPIAKLRTAVGNSDLGELQLGNSEHALLTGSLALWLREEQPRPPATHWEALFTLPHFPGDLPDTELGLLRGAKLPAWYLLEGSQCEPKVTGGLAIEEHRVRFLAALKAIDSSVYKDLVQVPLDDERWTLMLRFVIELYLLRSAERISPNVEKDWSRLTVADAVGASACFPPVFPPFTVMGIYDDQHVARLGLTDGGVYDNIGIRALLDEGCNCIIASDTGGVFKEARYAPPGHLQMVPRIPNILMRAVGELQRLDVKERRRFAQDVSDIEHDLPKLPETEAARRALDAAAAVRGLGDLAYFHMASAPPSPEGALQLKVDGRNLAELRTDLDGFGEIEIAGLVNHGYDTADRFVREYMTGWHDCPPRAPRPEIDEQQKHVADVIRAGQGRFMRGLKTRAPLTWAVTLTALAAVVISAVRGTSPAGLVGSVARVWSWGANLVVAMVDALLPRALEAPVHAVPRLVPDLVWPWLRDRWSDPRTVLGILVLIVAIKGIRWAARAVAPRFREHGFRLTWPQTTWKWLVSLRGNLLWFAWALPLVIAAVVSVFALLSYTLFYLPWQRSARIRSSDLVRSKPAVEEVLQPR